MGFFKSLDNRTHRACLDKGFNSHLFGKDHIKNLRVVLGKACPCPDYLSVKCHEPAEGKFYFCHSKTDNDQLAGKTEKS